MKEKTARSQSSVKNATISLIYYFISTMFTFLMKMVLVRYIGIEYSGLNSLLTNIIGVLNIAELGLGTAIGYSLYKPLAEEDHKKINEILCLYKYLYRIIAVVITIIGIVITIFIDHFVNTTISMSEVRISFVLYLIATVASYLLTFLNVLPSADQKNYMVVRIQNNGKIIKDILQLFGLAVFRNFYLWIIIEIISNISIYLYTNIRIKKMYDWYDEYEKYSLKTLIKKYNDIVKRTKELVFHKIGSLFVYQTDIILISYFCNLTDSGIYSNYMLIYNLLTGVVEQAFMGITASIGNFIIEKKEKDVYNIWKEMYVVMFCVMVLFGFLFYQLANPFIKVCFGDYTLSSVVVFAIALNIMFRVIKNPIDKFKEAYGIFWDIYAPIVESLINLVFSVALAFKFGILGIVIGTVISNIAITIIWKPYVVFKYAFKEKFSQFILINIRYLIIGLIGSAISYILISLIHLSIENSVLNLIALFAVNGVVAVSVIMICFMCDKFFRDTIKKYCNVVVRMLKKA